MRLALVFAALVGAALTTTAASAENQDSARPFHAASLQQMLDAHKGRPVIVHFWGLTCGNCVAKLKDWGEFARTHLEATLVLANWDRRGAQPAQMASALYKAGPGAFPSFALGDGYEEKLRFAVDPDWMGELPYTRLIGGDGSATTFSGSADFTDLGAWLSKEKH
jgi:thiol-disulfide isomerase/thioredoxin